MPCVLVSTPSESALTAASGTISTVAPIWGVPAESRTTPESLPAAAFACAADVFAPTEKHVSIRMRAPKDRRRSCFTWYVVLPPGRCVGGALCLQRGLHGEVCRLGN